MIRIPVYKKLFSYLYPVRIRRAAGIISSELEVFLYCNQLQLTTSDAMYSDGNRYIPAVTAINKLKSSLHGINSVLVLGAGLGSMARVLQKKGYHPEITLVDKDKVVLEWAIEFLEDYPGKIIPVCRDAKLFMEEKMAKYDLIFIDVFIGRVVPDFVISPVFLASCRESLTDSGHLAFNYIVNNQAQWEEVKTQFMNLFPNNNITSVNVNRILIGTGQ